LGKLRVFSGKEVCKILEKHGFVEVRRRGSHIAMQRKTSLSTVTVLSIIRQSGLSRSEFE